MARIFINYRRDDTAGIAGRLHDHLAKSLPRSAIFMDVDTMLPGVDFVKQIEAQVGQCDVLLAVMGRRWMEAVQERATTRARNDKDYVRIEVASALSRDIPVIPVLVDGATMPDEEDLPDDLKSLARRHAVELRHTRFTADAGAIVSALRAVDSKGKSPWAGRLAIGAAAVAICLSAGLLAYWLMPAAGGDRTAHANRADASRPSAGGAQPTASSTVASYARRGVDEAKRRLEEAKARIAAFRGQPSATASEPTPSGPPALPGATITSLSVALGDNRERVKQVYPNAADAGRGDLTMPLDGIRFFFTKDAGILNNIRVDAPFIGRVRGVRINDQFDDVVVRLGQPSYTRGSSYFYRLDGNIIRFDVNSSGRVETIFQLLERR
jgi:hypothetical protein